MHSSTYVDTLSKHESASSVTDLDHDGRFGLAGSFQDGIDGRRTVFGQQGAERDSRVRKSSCTPRRPALRLNTSNRHPLINSERHLVSGMLLFHCQCQLPLTAVLYDHNDHHIENIHTPTETSYYTENRCEPTWCSSRQEWRSRWHAHAPGESKGHRQ